MRIGIDIGGRHIGCALIDNLGHIVNFTDTYVNKKWSLSEIGKNVSKMVSKVSPDLKDIINIGIGIPGAVNSKTGFVDYSCNLPFRKVNLKKYFKKILNKEVKIENDANCAAFGELLFGRGKGNENIVLVTVGTGIGSGIVINRKIYSGSNGYAGEIGHNIVVANGRECNCGNKGCLESYASMSSIEKRAHELQEYYLDSKLLSSEISGKNIYEFAKEGDLFSKELVNEQLFYLGIGIANMINLLQPEMVIISGAVSAQKEFLLKNLKPEIDKNLYVKNTYILDTSSLENKAGIIGAAFL